MLTERAFPSTKSAKLISKNDSYDAQCVARVAINELHNLPDAMPEDMYWTLSQLVNRRSNLKVHHIRLKNQLHEQVCIAYPGYKQFFQDIGRPTALYFWEHYPSPRLLQGKTVEELAEELIPISHNQFSIRKCQKILDAIKADGDTTRDYQPERDEITRGLVRDVRHYVTQLEEVDKAISDFLPRFECTLNTIPGVNDTTVAKLLSEIGDIRRFSNADKKELKFLANFAGIAPVRFSSSGKGDDKPSKQGNRRLQGTIYLRRQLVVFAITNDPAIVQRIAKKSQLLRLLSKAVGKREIKTASLDSDLQTFDQHHLRNAEKQDGVPDARTKNIITYIIYRKTDCDKNKNMVKWSYGTIVLQGVLTSILL